MKVFKRMKKTAKKSKVIVDLYGDMIGIIFLFSPIYASKTLYFISTGRKMNLDNPKGFNEKLMWLKHYWDDPLKSKCSDKLLVRDFVRDCGCEEILNEVYAVYNNISEINWDDLPESFVLKCTYGSGANIICPNKSELDIKEAQQILKKGMKPSFLNKTAEFHGNKKVNKIICEKYIDFNQLAPIDYKVYCFNGKPYAILAIGNRFTELTEMLYDTDWNEMIEYANNEVCKGSFKKPNNLDQILYYARRLSQEFPFVRADFYSDEKSVIFGELTFTPSGCLSKVHNELGDRYLGELLQIPLNKIDTLPRR